MSSLAKAVRKIKRKGKTASQFKFTSLFEYFKLGIKGSWRPETLRIVWVRNHRKAVSPEIKWAADEDFGAGGANCHVSFEPPISLSLIVTLYRDSKEITFEDKEYKFYIESDGPGGKKVLGIFNCNVSEYAAVPSCRTPLEMEFRPLSQKVEELILGLTLEAEFQKQGSAADEDMQSTYSAVSHARDSYLGLEEEEASDEGSPPTVHKKHSSSADKKNRGLSVVSEEQEQETELDVNQRHSVVLLGTGESVRRSMIIDSTPPPKPARRSFKEGKINNNPSNDKESPELEQHHSTIVVVNGEDNAMAVIEKNGGGKEEVDGVDGVEEGQQQPQSQQRQMSDGSANAPAPTSTAAQQDSETTGTAVLIINGSTTGNLGGMVEMNVTTGEKKIEVSEENDSSKCNSSNKPQTEAGVSKETMSNGSKSEETKMPEPKKEINNEETEQGVNNKEKALPGAEPTVSKQRAAVNPLSSFDFIFEASRMIASVSSQNRTNAESNESTESSKSAATDSSKKSMEEEEGEEESQKLPLAGATSNSQTTTTTATTPKGIREEFSLEWLKGAKLVNPLGRGEVAVEWEKVELFGLYFFASWCPPCRKFVPKLIKFYQHLKQQNKPFEIICISSDKTKEEMYKYMQDSKMEWVAVDYSSPVGTRLRNCFGVESIPRFVIVNKDSVKVAERAKKSVEGATSSSLSVKVFGKWMDVSHSQVKRVTSSESTDGGVEDDSKDSKQIEEEKKDKVESSGILRKRTKSKPALEVLAQKDEKIQYLEEVNLTLKQTNTELLEEVAELKRQLEAINSKLKELEKSSKEMEEDQRGLLANLNIRGWLFKRGAKGPTASVWRRRYFRCDQGSKIYYYKSATEGSPQGFIDLDQVVSVQAVSTAQQDKNNATFLVQCSGRTFQLQAHDEVTMRKWMGAIEYLRKWRSRNARKLSRSPSPN